MVKNILISLSRLCDNSEACSAPSLRRSPVELSPVTQVLICPSFIGFPPLSVSLPTPSLCFLGTSSQILAPKSFIPNLLGRVPKRGHFQNSSPILPFHAPLTIANFNYKLNASCTHSSVVLFFLCLFPRSPSGFHLFFVCLLLRTSPSSIYFTISTKNDCSAV